MISRISILAAVAALLGSVAARADVIDGSFAGTMTGGTDTTGVFGTPGADLTNDAVTGTFVYDTTLFSQNVSGSQNTATGNGLGALTVTVTIGGLSHTFTDNTSSSIMLDDSASQIILANTNTDGGDNENFSLEADDILSPFITSTDLAQNFSTNDPFLNSTGSFFIQDAGATVQAGGGFAISSISATTASSPMPEPASLTLLTLGLGGLAGARARKRRAV